MIEERRAEIERSIEKLKEYRQLRVDYYLKWDGIMPEGFLQMVQDDIHWAEERITELREQLPPLMSQRQLRAIEEIPEVLAEVTGKKIGGTVVVKKNPIMKRIMELENRKDTLYQPLVAISPFTYREAIKDITEAIERLKKLPSDIVEYGLLPCHVETIIQNYDCLVEEDDQLWIERNIISQDTLESIRAHAFKEVGRIAVVDMQCKVLSNGFYSSKVAKTYTEYTKRMNEEYREMLDKAHKEALDENLRRGIRTRFDKEREEALCEAADKALQEYADIAAGRAEPAEAADYEEFPVELHHSANGDKRFEGALPDDPATKQRKSLGRAIIDLLNTKYK